MTIPILKFNRNKRKSELKHVYCEKCIEKWDTKFGNINFLLKLIKLVFYYDIINVIKMSFETNKDVSKNAAV